MGGKQWKCRLFEKQTNRTGNTKPTKEKQAPINDIRNEMEAVP